MSRSRSRARTPSRGRGLKRSNPYPTPKSGGPSKKFKSRSRSVSRSSRRSYSKLSNASTSGNSGVSMSYLAGHSSKTVIKKGPSKIPKVLKFISGTLTALDHSALKMSDTTDKCSWGFRSIMDLQDMQRFGSFVARQRYLQEAGQLPLTVDSDTDYWTRKVYIQSGSEDLKILNGGIFPVEIHFYDVACKRDCYIDPITMLGADVTDLNQSRDSSRPYNVALTGSNVGYRPLDSPTFKAYWYIKKNWKITLAPGECHTHLVTTHWNRILPLTIGKNYNSNAKYFAGFTTGVIFKAVGFPVGSADNGNAVNSGPTAVAIDCVQRITLRGCHMPSKHIEAFDSTTAVSNPTVVEELVDKVIKVAAGVVTDVAVASVFG